MLLYRQRSCRLAVLRVLCVGFMLSSSKVRTGHASTKEDTTLHPPNSDKTLAQLTCNVPYTLYKLILTGISAACTSQNLKVGGRSRKPERQHR